MDTSIETLSAEYQLDIIPVEQTQIVPNKEIVIKDNAVQELALYADALSKILSAGNFSEDLNDEDFSDEYIEIDLSLAELGVHPLILEERNEALSLLSSILSEADHALQELESSFNGPICPYQATLVEYLGPNFKPPSIYDLTIPPSFSLAKAVETINNFGTKIHNDTNERLDVMLKESMDTNFPGITSQNIGNAFAVLSSTVNGQEYVIDNERLAKHLEFAEIVRNLPAEAIDENPLMVALKLVARYEEISK